MSIFQVLMYVQSRKSLDEASGTPDFQNMGNGEALLPKAGTCLSSNPIGYYYPTYQPRSQILDLAFCIDRVLSSLVGRILS
jgi:hypothetical protein